MIEVPARFNAATFFVDRHVAEGRGAKVAFFHDEGSITYAGLQELVNRTGNALLDLGVRPEQRVLCLLLDSPEFLGAFWGAIKIGAIPIPTNTMMRADDYLYFLDDSRAPVAVVSEALLAEAGPALAKARYLRHVIVAGRASGTQIAFDELGGQGRPRGSSPSTPRRTIPRSGSTPRARPGRPKGAVHLQHDMVVCSDTYALQVLGMTEADRTVSAAKLFFAYGLGNNGYFPLRVGGQGVLYPHRPTPDAMFELIQRHRPTLFFGVPTLYAAMLQVKEAEKRYDLSCLRLCVSAGEALPEELYRRWQERFGVEILDGIGTTEILHIFLSNRPGRARPGSTGLAVPGYEAIVVDDEGRPMPAGEIGNLRVKGDSTMAYYWNQHEKTKDALVGPLDPDRRQVLPGRGRLLLVLRPRRRHAQGRRHLGLAGRGGEHPDGPSRHPGDRGGGARGHRRADQAEGLRGAEGRARGLGGPRGRAQGLREGQDRALQVSALDRVRAGAAQDRDGQDPALQASAVSLVSLC